MADTKFVFGKINIAETLIQDYFDLFYELESISITNGNIFASLQLSDTPGTTVKTAKLIYAPKAIANAQIESNYALGYSLIYAQPVGNLIFAYMVLNGVVMKHYSVISQSGINAPVLVVQKNTLRMDLTSNYDAVGNYHLSSPTDIFTANKTLVNFSNCTNTVDGLITLGAIGTTEIYLNTAIAGVDTDGIIKKMPLKIEVYP